MPFPPYPDVPSPATWVDGGPLLTTALRDDVTNAVLFLANRPAFTGYCTSAPSIPGTFANTAVTLDTEVIDTWGQHWPLGSYPQYYFVPVEGYYLAEGYVPFAYNSTSEATFTAGIQSGNISNVTTYIGEMHPNASSRNPGVIVSDIITMSNPGAVDASGVSVLGLACSQNSGAGVSLDGSGATTLLPRLSVRWVCSVTGTAPLPVPGNPSWPVPPAYIDQSWLNPNVRDTINFLIYPPLLRYTYRAGTYQLPTGTFPVGNPVPLDTLTNDNYSGWSQSANGGGGAYVVPANGVYYCHGMVVYGPSSSPGNYWVGFSINGNQAQWCKGVQAEATGAGVSIAAVKRLRLTAGQTVTLMGAQSTGSKLQIVGSGQPVTKLIMLWESA